MANPKYRNYTTTTSFADVLTVTNTYSNAIIINSTGEAVEITFDNQNDTILYIPSGGTISGSIPPFIQNIRAKCASGGSGASGLYITIW